MQERRRYPRYERADLVLTVARPGISGFLRLNPTAQCLDFSITGLQFGSDQTFQIGEKLILDLSVYNVSLDEIPVYVVKSQQEPGGIWCTGVRFCFDTKRMRSPKVHRSLLQIENRLRQAEEFPFLND